jgi:hypothetical protein
MNSLQHKKSSMKGRNLMLLRSFRAAMQSNTRALKRATSAGGQGSKGNATEQLLPAYTIRTTTAGLFVGYADTKAQAEECCRYINEKYGRTKVKWILTKEDTINETL